MLETTSNKVVYELNGESNVFAFPIRFFQPSDIVCYLDNVKLESGVDFVVETKSNYENGANITLNVEGKTGAKLAIMRILPEIQETSLPEYGKILSSSLEKQLDKIVMICQQMKEGIDRSVKIDPAGENTPDEMVQLIQKCAEDAATAKEAAEAAAAGISTVCATVAEFAQGTFSPGQLIQTAGYYASGMEEVVSTL